jgi:hypothetical protein
MALKNKWQAMGLPELRMIMQDWPHVLRQATNDWAKDFAVNVWKRAGNGQWRPTEKQARVMRRLYRELSRNGDEVNLIE